MQRAAPTTLGQRRVGRRQFLKGALAATGALGLLAACGGEAAPPASPTGTPARRQAQIKTDFGVSDSEIKLGHVGILSGPLQAVYAPITYTLQAYFRKVNEEEGGVCGRRINFIVEDSQNNPSRALEALRKLVEGDQVAAVVRPTGIPTVQLATDYARDRRVPILLIGSGTSLAGDYRSSAWTTEYLPPSEPLGRFMARYVQQNFPNRSVAVLYENQDLFRLTYEGLRAEFRGQIVTVQSYESGAADITSQIVNLRGSNPDIVHLAVSPAFGAQVFRYMRSSGWRPQVVSHYFNVPSTVAALVGGGEGIQVGFQQIAGLVTTHWAMDPVGDAGQPAMQEHRRIMERFGGPGTAVSNLTANNQIGAEIVVETLRRACDAGDLTREGILRAHESIRGFHPTLLYPGINVDLGPQDHYAIQHVMVVRVEADGRLTPLLREPALVE